MAGGADEAGMFARAVVVERTRPLEAARLTELAKLEPGHVLASSIAVADALDAEALCWDVGEIVELRGRTAPTQLARPINLFTPGSVDGQVPDDVSSRTR